MEDIALTPFAHTKGLYFNDKLEPQNEEYNIYKDIKKAMENGLPKPDWEDYK